MPPKAATKADVPTEPEVLVEPLIETGTFHYDSGASYEGEFTMMLEDGRFFVPPPEEDTEDAGAKKAPPKAEEAEAEPAKPPVRVRQGKGVFKDGVVSYEGEFVRDQFHGQGTFTFGSGSTYTGNWVSGVFQGLGKYTWTDGSCYEGEFESNQFHGQGLYTDKQGHQWAGLFEKNSGPGLINQL